jgi:pectin methylesterase-like acyl-CoA thioesterase
MSPVHADQKDRARADRLLERSVPLYNKKQYKAALELCRQAILADPTYARAFVGLGSCQEKLKQRQAACAAYRQALILSPDARDKNNALAGLKRLGCPVAPPAPYRPKPLKPLPTPSKVISVSAEGDGDYQTIGEAVEAAPAHARITIRPGRYEESVVLGKPLQLVGDGMRPEVIIAGIDKPALIIQAKACFLRDLTFKAFSVKDADFAAIEVRDGEGTFEKCEIGAQSHSGMRVSSGATAVLRQTRFVGARTTNLVFNENSGGRVEDCDIVGAKVSGVEVGSGANPSFLHTKIRHNKAKEFSSTSVGAVRLWIVP